MFFYKNTEGGVYLCSQLNLTMIKEIKIENFKSIQSLNLELGRLNVFIGANGSGKSNILEGIAFGGAAESDKLDNEFLAARGIRIVKPKQMKAGFTTIQDETIIVDIINNETESLNEISWDGTRWIDSIRKLSDVLISEINKGKTFSNPLENNEILKLIEKIEKDRISFSQFSKYLIFAPENYFLRRFEEESQIKPLGIRGEGLFSHIVDIYMEQPELYKKINEYLKLLDWFEGFEIPLDLMFTERRLDFKDAYLKDGIQYLDQRSVNEGALYLLFYLTLFISDKTPKFFAIDNIDNAMNPKLGSELIRVLSKLAKEHDKQTILTTHNPSVLDGLDLSDDEQRLFVISRNKSGHTQAIRVPYKESDERLSTRFIRGAIGGLPKNF